MFRPYHLTVFFSSVFFLSASAVVVVPAYGAPSNSGEAASKGEAQAGAGDKKSAKSEKAADKKSKVEVGKAPKEGGKKVEKKGKSGDSSRAEGGAGSKGESVGKGRADSSEGGAPPRLGIADPKSELEKMKLKEKLKESQYRKYGIELRGGGLFVPEFLLLGLFFDEAEGMANGDFGLAFVLRSSRSFEFVFGVNYHLFNFYDRTYPDGKPIPRVFLDKGDPAYEREFIKNTLSYMSIDVRFQKLFFLHERFQILIGGGVGLGIIFGEVWRQDTYIPDYDSAKEASGEYRKEYLRWKEDPETNRSGLPNKPCSPPKAGEPDELAKRNYCENFEPWKEDRVPPVIPTVDLVLGLVFPVVIDRWDLRIQGGMGLPRFFWVGMSTHIYF